MTSFHFKIPYLVFERRMCNAPKFWINEEWRPLMRLFSIQFSLHFPSLFFNGCYYQNFSISTEMSFLLGVCNVYWLQYHFLLWSLRWSDTLGSHSQQPIRGVCPKHTTSVNFKYFLFHTRSSRVFITITQWMYFT